MFTAARLDSWGSWTNPVCCTYCASCDACRSCGWTVFSMIPCPGMKMGASEVAPVVCGVG